jgi:uncharacterized protein
MLNDQKNGVTIVIKRLVKHNHAKEYKDLISQSYLASIKFAGFLGLDVFNDQKTEHITFVYRFDTEEHLDIWLVSDQAKVYTQKMSKISSDTELEKLSGLEYWFNYTADSMAKPPSRVKMVLATVVGVYPLQVLVTSPALELARTMIPQIPLFVLSLVSSVFSITLLTYVIMPQVTKLLQTWLYPKTDTDD